MEPLPLTAGGNLMVTTPVAPPVCSPMQRSLYPGSCSAGRLECTPGCDYHQALKNGVILTAYNDVGSWLWSKLPTFIILCVLRSLLHEDFSDMATTTVTTWPTGATAPITVASLVGGAAISTFTSPAAVDGTGGPSASPTTNAGDAGGGGSTSTPHPTASNGLSGSGGANGAETSSSNVPAPPGTSSFDTGTLAGAVVGAFIGGLIIGLAVMLLVSRRRKRNQKHGLSNQPPIEMHNEVVRPKDRGPTDRHLQADSSLLDATSDGELAEAYRNIHKLLQQHMDNFYHRKPVDVSFAMLKSAAERLELVYDDVLDLDTLLSLVLDPRTRAAALHHIIAQVLVKSIDFNPPGNLSMLPPHLTGLARSFPAAERGGGNSDAYGKSLHQWRTLTAYLMQPHRSHRLPLVPSEESVKPQTDVLTSALVDFLGPFIAVDDVSQAKQRSHLQAIAFECAKFGYLLLSQPREWQFVYHNAGQARGQHGVVLHPGLQKLGGQGGGKRGGPQLVEAPVIAKI
ncbi:hypothetical protein PG991_014614 [Apiospora marii]|uniref:Uncharacterized protein n=1 Tax=Apiospora marii TaxID=335849 RepID=A0ABR1R427_9PEZI